MGARVVHSDRSGRWHGRQHATLSVWRRTGDRPGSLTCITPRKVAPCTRRAGLDRPGARPADAGGRPPAERTSLQCCWGDVQREKRQTDKLHPPQVPSVPSRPPCGMLIAGRSGSRASLVQEESMSWGPRHMNAIAAANTRPARRAAAGIPDRVVSAAAGPAFEGSPPHPASDPAVVVGVLRRNAPLPDSAGRQLPGD